MKIENNKLRYIIVIFVFLLLQLPYLDSVKKIIVDECSYSNVAYNFSAGNGFVDTSMGGDVYCFLYPFVVGVFFYVFGTTLFVARLVSVIAGVISLIGVLFIFDTLKVSNKAKYISSLLFVFSYNYFLIFRFARPEAWVFVFFIWAIYFQIKYWYGQKNIFIFLSGLLSGVSVLFHPWGFSFGLLFGVYSIIISINRKSFIPVSVYLLGVVPFIFVLFLNALVINGIPLNEFIVRFGERSTVADGGSGFFVKMKQSFSGLFAKYDIKSGRIFIVLLHAFIAFFGLSYYKKNKIIFNISVLQIALFIITILFYSGGGVEYMLHYLFAFSFLNIALLINENVKKYRFDKILLVLLALFFLNNAIGIFLVEKADYKNPYREVTKNIQQQIPKSSLVLSPIEFWYSCKEAEFYNSNSIWAFKKYKNISELLNSGNLDYLIKADGIKFSQTEENINAMEKCITEKGKLIYSLPTSNMGTISVYKVK